MTTIFEHHAAYNQSAGNIPNTLRKTLTINKNLRH